MGCRGREDVYQFPDSSVGDLSRDPPTPQLFVQAHSVGDNDYGLTTGRDYSIPVGVGAHGDGQVHGSPVIRTGRLSILDGLW